MKHEPDWEDIVAMLAMHAILQKSKSMSYDDIADHAYKMADSMAKVKLNRTTKSERKKNEREDD